MNQSDWGLMKENLEQKLQHCFILELTASKLPYLVLSQGWCYDLTLTLKFHDWNFNPQSHVNGICKWDL